MNTDSDSSNVAKRWLAWSPIALLLIGSCGGKVQPGGLTISPSPASGEYEIYLTEVENLGGDVIGKEDAAIRATLLCTGDPEEMLGGVSIDNFPTDLALLRAFCPDKEARYR